MSCYATNLYAIQFFPWCNHPTVGLWYGFLVSGSDLACQQEVSLAQTKAPPIHYYNVVNSAFSNYGG